MNGEKVLITLSGGVDSTTVLYHAIKNYGRENVEASLMIQIDEEIEDYLAQGQKIQAIKYYRNEISKLTGTEPLLKESKKYVDSIQIYMERRNMI